MDGNHYGSFVFPLRVPEVRQWGGNAPHRGCVVRAAANPGMTLRMGIGRKGDSRFSKSQTEIWEQVGGELYQPCRPKVATCVFPRVRIVSDRERTALDLFVGRA